MSVFVIIMGILLLWIIWGFMYHSLVAKEGMDNSNPSNYQPIPASGIPYGYYRINVNGTDMMTPVPYGYRASPDKNSIVAYTKSAITDTSMNPTLPSSSGIPTKYVTDVKGNLLSGYIDASGRTVFSTTSSGHMDSSGNQRYDPNSYDTKYHDDISAIMQKNDGGDISFNSYYSLDACGNPVLITRAPTQTTPTYNIPGTYTYGPSSYVPNYEESVFLSKTSHQPSYAHLYDTAAMKAGFCSQLQNAPADIERKCNAIDLNNCASTSCCVLLGGAKCVAGNQNGPTMQTNYSDLFIKDPTYYFFQGKCYGNCVQKYTPA